MQWALTGKEILTTCYNMDESWIHCAFPGGSDGKESACNVGDLGLIPGSGRSPGKEMATHSSIPAWKIPWTEEPGGLQSMGLQRVGHDWETSTWIHYANLNKAVTKQQILYDSTCMKYLIKFIETESRIGVYQGLVRRKNMELSNRYRISVFTQWKSSGEGWR